MSSGTSETRVGTGESRERLVRIETKMDSFLTSMKDHEDRLRVLEQGRGYTLGLAAALSVFLSMFSGKIVAALLH